MARRWAVLIDADNVRAEVADPLFAQVAEWGDACVRRMYGNFDGNHVAWKEASSRHSIAPVQLPRLAAGKNGADMALVIDAVDLTHRGHMDGFCLVSADSDFAGLAWRLRQDGRIVRAVGADTAVAAYRAACSEFVTVSELIGRAMVDSSPPVDVVRAIPRIAVQASGKRHPGTAVPVLLEAFARLPSDRKWHGLSAFGMAMRSTCPSFRPADFEGCSSLLSVIEKSCSLGIRRDRHGHPEVARKS